jgi:DNA-binding PadR family transcriptional regulator
LTATDCALTLCKTSETSAWNIKNLKQEQNKTEGLPRLSNKEAIILDLLLDKASRGMYGLELVAESGERLKRGTVYVTLSRMEDKGFVQSGVEPTSEECQLPRRIYRVTGYGQRVHKAWELAKLTIHGFVSDI